MIFWKLPKDQSKINILQLLEQEQDAKIVQSNVSVLKIIKERKELVNLYDKNNITILPNSYTEGYPMVIMGSLSRHETCNYF